MKFLKKGLSVLIVFMMILQLFAAMPIANAATPNVDVVFMSDLHNANGGYLGFKQMLTELKNDGQSPRVFSHGGDYVEDSMGGQVDWQTKVYDVIHGDELTNFPDAKQGYTLGNHDWESGTFGGNRDKEAAFKAMFGFDRCGLGYSDDELEIYYIGAQGETGAGGGGEAFIQADIDAFDAYLASVEGSGKVIFLQTHWPAHSAYNFKQRVVTNSDKVIDVINKHAEDTDIVWIWGHNHYEDEMRYEILKPGDQIMYAADTNGSSWGNPRNPQYKTINFTYANAGCMNDMWYHHDGHNDTNAGNNYRGPSACLSVAVNKGDITFTYNRIRQENEANGSGNWVYSHDANIQIYNHNVLKEHPSTVVVDRKTSDHEHNYIVSKVVAPTCTDAGYTLEKCTICDSERTTNPTEALGHDWDEGVVTTEATTDHAGVMTYTCQRCGETKTARIPRIPSGEMDDVDFTDPSEESKFEIVNKDTAEITEGTGLSMTPTADAFEPVSAGWGGQGEPSTPKDLIKVSVSGDWTATTKVDFDVNGVQWAMNSYFGFLAMQGEDYQNMAGIRGTNNVFQDYLRKDGTVNTNTIVPTPGYQDTPTSGFTANGTYYLRLDKQDTTYTGSWSADGETYTELFKMEDTGIDAEYIVLDAYKTSSMSFGGDANWLFTLKSLEFGEGSAPSEVDYTALNKAISDAEKIDKTQYTDASVARLESALSAAKDAKASISQSEVDAAAAALNNAIAGLVKKPVNPPADGEYVLADGIEAGKTYVIVADGAYAMTNAEVPGLASYATGSVTRGAAAVTIEGDKITSAVDDSMLWTFTDASESLTAYDEQPVYFIQDSTGKYLQRGSMSRQNTGLILADSLHATMRYNTWSAKAYDDAASEYCLYVNSERAYGNDYPARVHGGADGFDVPSPLSQRDPADPFAFMNSENTSRIRFYVAGEGGGQTVEIDTSALEAAIETAEGIDRSKYTDESVAALDAALTAARAALTAEDQETVNAAAEALGAAVAALELRPVVPEVDRTALNKALADAAKIDKSKYTDETVAALDTAVAAANALAADADQAAVDAAAKAINDAIAGLKEKSVTPPPEGDWVLADKIEAGKTYVIVSEGAYAMTNEEVPGKESYADSSTTMGAKAVTVADGVITSEVDETMLWTFTEYDGPAAYDGLDQYYVQDSAGKYLRRGSMSQRNGALILEDSTSAGKPRYYAWSFKDYEGMEATYAMYTNSENAYGTDYPGRVGGSASGFDLPSQLDQRSDGDPFAFMNDGVCSHITLYTNGEDRPVDKSKLDKAIEDAEAIDTAPYTEESAKALADAIEAAKAVKADENATQAAVNAAAKAVNDAVKALEKKPAPVDKTALDAAITAAEAIDTAPYTDESVAVLDAAIAAAKTVQADPDATQAAVDASAKAVDDAVKALEKKPEPPKVDKSELDKAITAGELYDENDYTPESYAPLAEALEAAKAVQAKEDAAQDEVDAAAKALGDAIAGLEKKPDALDKDALIAAISEAEALDPAEYTEESAKALADGIAAAKDALANAADQAAVDAAVEALKDVVDKLEKKPDVEPFRFDDVKDEGKFYFTPVYWAYEAEPQITNGKTATLFGPDDGCTRGQVVTFLWRAAGCPEPKSAETPFTDLKEGGFYVKAVAWAVENEITNGMTATTFAPDATCTRGQIVTFLWRFAGQVEPKSTKTDFTDVPESAFYAKAVAWAVENEVTNGMTPTTFVPGNTCTRGQVVTFLYRATAE